MKTASFVICWFLASSMYWKIAECTIDDSQEDLEYSSSTGTTFRSCLDGHPHGSHWTERRKCTLCTCDDGQINCKPNPLCCERSDRKSNVSHYYRDGEQWEDGCSVCTCSNGVEQCPIRECRTVHLPPRAKKALNCPHPHYVTDKCGCHTLNCYRTCKVENRVSQGRLNHPKAYRHGLLWNEFKTKNECVSCLCVHGDKLCLPKPNCPDTVERYGCKKGYVTVLPGRCCPTWVCLDEDRCLMSEWSSWGRCSQSCGLGNSTRTRAVLKKMTDNSTCSTTDVRRCYLRHCAGHQTKDNAVMHRLKDKPDHLLLVREENGCRSVNRVTTTLCNEDKCKRYALFNRPLIEETIKVPMECPNGAPGYHRLFARVKACGCLAL